MTQLFGFAALAGGKADNKVEVLTLSANAGTDLGDDFSLTFRLRSYDYDNSSPRLEFPGYVRLDAVWEEIALLTTWVAHLGVATEAGAPAAEGATTAARAPSIPAGVDPSLATDLFLQAKWGETGTEPAAMASDATPSTAPGMRSPSSALSRKRACAKARSASMVNQSLSL